MKWRYIEQTPRLSTCVYLGLNVCGFSPLLFSPSNGYGPENEGKELSFQTVILCNISQHSF